MRSLFKWATALTFAITFAAPTFAGTWSWSLTGSGVSASGVLTTLGDATSFEAVTGISGAFNGNAINGLVPLNSDARFIYNNLFAFNGATPAIDGFGLLIDVAVLGHLNLLGSGAFSNDGYDAIFYPGTRATVLGPLTLSAIPTVAAVPEPSAMALMLSGFAASAFVLRRRRAPPAV